MPPYVKNELLRRSPPGGSIVVKGGDLRVGDQIVGARTGMLMEWTWWAGQILTEQPSASIDRAYIVLGLRDIDGNLVWYDYPRYNEYLIIRPDAVTATTSDSAYPGKCTRCEGPAYVGASVVDCKAKCH